MATDFQFYYLIFETNFESVAGKLLENSRSITLRYQQLNSYFLDGNFRDHVLSNESLEYFEKKTYDPAKIIMPTQLDIYHDSWWHIWIIPSYTADII